MHTFTSMNTQVAVIAPTADEGRVANQVAHTFFAAEQRFSRFRADSELSALNRAEHPFAVSEVMFSALLRAQRYMELTDGIFDPGVGSLLCSLGYDRSFQHSRLDPGAPLRCPAVASFREVHLDASSRQVTRPPHVHIDLGGMLKGATVDAAARAMPALSALDAGGDAMLRGRGPEGEGWLVDVEDPLDSARALVTLRVCDKGVATSAANRRTWQLGDSQVHHLIDPRTQCSSGSDLAQATVVAPSVELADVLAKTLFVLGERAARRFMRDKPQLGAVLVPCHGAPVLLGNLNVQEVHHA